MPIISGLTSTNQLEGFFSLNSRRKVFYEFPNGAAPLIGLLSMLDTEATDKPIFGWWEERYITRLTKTAGISAGNGPFSATGSNTPLTAAGFNITAGQVIRVLVTDTSVLRVTNTLWLKGIPNGATTVTDIKGVVTAIIDATHFEFRVLTAFTGIKNGDGTSATVNCTALPVIVIGTANEEGSSSVGNGVMVVPINPINFTQIFRTPFGFPRTALKVGLKYDSSGPYKTKAKKNAIDHMVDLEFSFLWGDKNEQIVTNNEGEQVPMKFTGGVLWFLEQWELGASAVDVNYPAVNLSATPVDSDEDKRIINNVSGVMTPSLYNDLMRRLFRVTSNKSFEKICLCGDQHLGVINEMLKNQTVLQQGTNITGGTWGPTWTTVRTIYGAVHYKTHPLFTRYGIYGAGFQYDGLYLDMGSLKYKYLSDSDTTLLKMRQAPDADRRKDEWLTEAGLEVNLPESHMYIKNLQRAQVG